jgi:REP element-mobilizing transposase RayT
MSDADHNDFIERLEYTTRGDRAFVYAWALIPNHFHLAIRTGTESLSSVMRRLMTGYAETFNHRYKRHGHLFQNRYKSTVVDDEAYLLSLVRYIHRNPLRARLVRSMTALARYPWTGHSSLTGLVDRTFQDNDEILGRFGRRAGEARKRMVAFIGDHKEAKKEESLFKGGGLIRSAGGIENLMRTPKEDRQMYDERILGDGQFVESILGKTELQKGPKDLRESDKVAGFEEVQRKICKRLKISPLSLMSGGRARQVVRARMIAAHVAGHYLGWAGKDLAEAFGVSATAISRGIARGEKEIPFRRRFLVVSLQ